MDRRTIGILERSGCFVLASFFVLGTPSASAQTHATVAEDLFQRGKEKMYAKAFSEACPLLAESYRLVPAGGTLQNLAVCYEETGKWASAYVSFQSLKAMSMGERPRPDRVALAQEHLAKLGARVSRARVRLSRRSLPVEVSIDGVRLADAALETGVPLDPGRHELSAQETGHDPYKKTFDVPTSGTQLDLTIPDLSPSRSPSANSEGDGGRVPAFVIGGLGVGALAASGLFGILTVKASSEGKDLCTAAGNGTAPRSDFSATGRCLEGSGALAAANDEKSRARTYGTVSGVLAPIGLIGVAVGIYWLVRSPPSESSKAAFVRFSPTVGGGSIEGTF